MHPKGCPSHVLEETHPGPLPITERDQSSEQGILAIIKVIFTFALEAIPDGWWGPTRSWPISCTCSLLSTSSLPGFLLVCVHCNYALG